MLSVLGHNSHDSEFDVLLFHTGHDVIDLIVTKRSADVRKENQASTTKSLLASETLNKTGNKTSYSEISV